MCDGEGSGEDSAMKRRNCDAKTKAAILIQGLKVRPVVAICQEHPISETQYDQWLDHFLTHAGEAFQTQQQIANHLCSEAKRIGSGWNIPGY